jgi:voltage-gated potassium channel
MSLPPRRAPWRDRWFAIIFGHDTPAGRSFDVWLIVAVVASIVVVALETLPELSPRVRGALQAAEWAITLLFTVEYVMRLATAHTPGRYARSFFGIVDLLSILPSWLSIVVPGAQALGVVRGIRVLRIFRIFKLGEYIAESEQLGRALYASRRKILVFLSAVLALVVVIGAAMFLVEGPASGFTSIPVSMYWAVVTLTTVGYGDIAPRTPFGRMLASMVMILGYGIIAVPTGIVSAEIARGARAAACPGCGTHAHDADARYCKRCGAELSASGAPGSAAAAGSPGSA